MLGIQPCGIRTCGSSGMAFESQLINFCHMQLLLLWHNVKDLGRRELIMQTTDVYAVACVVLRTASTPRQLGSLWQIACKHQLAALQVGSLGKRWA